jgi:hypothetical protein
MKKRILQILAVLTIGTLGLTGCSNKIPQDLTPSLIPSFLTFPELPEKYSRVDPVTSKSEYPDIIIFEKEFQSVVGICLVERKVLYDDLISIGNVSSKINYRWWKRWK